MKDIIGMLDTGVGGVSVLQKATELLPHESFLFYGDNKNAPYGPRPLAEIRALSQRAVDYLLQREVKALVIACNTITSAYAAELRDRVSIPVIGMEPAVKPASLVRTSGVILTLATRATLSLEKFSRLMELYGEGVIPLEGKGLVELVEHGKAGSPEAQAALEALFKPYRAMEIDGIVLGCTHYPFLSAQIEALFPHTPLFDGREGTVRQLQRRLTEENLLSANREPGTITFASSGGEESLKLMRQLYRTAIV